MSTHRTLVHDWIHQWPSESWNIKGAIDNGIVKTPSKKYASYPGYENTRTGGCCWKCYDSYQTHVAAVLWSEKLKKYVVVLENPNDKAWSKSTREHLIMLYNAIPPTIRYVFLPERGASLHTAIEAKFSACSPKGWHEDEIVATLISESYSTLDRYWSGKVCDENNIGLKSVRELYLRSCNDFFQLVEVFGYCKVVNKAKLDKLKAMAEKVKNYTAKDKKAFTEQQQKAYLKKQLESVTNKNAATLRKLTAYVTNRENRFPQYVELSKFAESKGMTWAICHICKAVLDSDYTEEELRQLFEIFKFLTAKIWATAKIDTATGVPVLSNAADPMCLELAGDYGNYGWVTLSNEDSLPFEIRRTPASMLISKNALVTNMWISLHDDDLRRAKLLLKRKFNEENVRGEKVTAQYTILRNDDKVVVGCHEFFRSHIDMWAALMYNENSAKLYTTDKETAERILSMFLSAEPTDYID